MKKFGVYCGRFNPIHVGHEFVINEMIKQLGIENCLLVIGSSNANFSLRHFFSYSERRDFIKKIFPQINVIGLPDYSTDVEWLIALNDLIKAFGVNAKDVIFYGGCEEDIIFFLEAGYTCEIINRFDGTTPKISATEVRDSLIYGRSLDNMINPIILDDVKVLFQQKWEKFKKI